MVADPTLRELEARILSCTDCRLHLSRKRAVPGEGPADASVMFVGEGPGFHENEQGRPFVGAAGKFLEELLEGIGLSRAEVFICNVVKCRPPGNRDPLPEEMDACAKYLEEQIRVVHPRVIVTLGRFSMARYFPGARISAIHGKSREIGGRMVVAMYHPAAALHQPSLRKDVQADFEVLRSLLSEAESQPETPPESSSDATQLNLF
ncbi:MAG TPA: uracil-DNA glycosylase [Anaerolineales bacterium]|nr:uracil-DNA glycosylase [Anaerolineales bacterium]